MNCRVIAGIFYLLAVFVVLSASALPETVFFPSLPEGKTGTAWVSLKNINGSMQEAPVFMTYAVGEVYEINSEFVSEDVRTGIVTVTVSVAEPSREYILTPKDSAGDSLYITNSIAVARESDPLLSNHLSFAAVPAAAGYYMDTVPEGKRHEWVDLDWKDPDYNLGLTVYAPDATFGPYDDIADGRKDGRIFLDFESLLNVTPGNWFFRVNNDAMSRIPYTLNTYSA